METVSFSVLTSRPADVLSRAFDVPEMVESFFKEQNRVVLLLQIVVVYINIVSVLLPKTLT